MTSKTPHRTITRMGFNFHFLKAKIERTNKTKGLTEKFPSVNSTLPDLNTVGIKIIRPAANIMDTTAGRRDKSASFKTGSSLYFV